MLHERKSIDNSDAEERFSRAAELTDAEAQPVEHGLAGKLAELLTDPRVSGDFFQTVFAVQTEVKQAQPPQQVIDDARYLLAWFQESVTPVAERPVAAQPNAATERPVLDAAAQEAARLRSIAAALTYNMANQYGTAEDAAAIAAALRV